MECYHYEVYGDDVPEDMENAGTLLSDWSDEFPHRIAEDAAKDYWNNADGWEDSWPVKIRVWNEAGDVLGDFTLEMEAEPTFSATEV